MKLAQEHQDFKTIRLAFLKEEKKYSKACIRKVMALVKHGSLSDALYFTDEIMEPATQKVCYDIINERYFE